MRTGPLDWAIVGAGPYGLSAGSHLRARGARVRLFGEPMGTWRRRMPTGMLLRSPLEGSTISDPAGELTIEAFEHERGSLLDRPVPRDDFLAYADWFISRSGLDLDARMVTRVERGAEGFELRLEDGERVVARHVAVATGLAGFPLRPAELEGLPRELVSHTSEEVDLDRFAGRRVLVLGGGQSALEYGVLLQEHGADAEVVARAPAVRWLGEEHPPRSTLGVVARGLYPSHGVGPPGLNRLVMAPRLLGRLPGSLRTWVSDRCVRPAAAGWLRPRMGDLRVTEGRSVVGARPEGDRAEIQLSDGTSRQVDHVVLGTGFTVDATRLELLAPEIRSSLVARGGYPRLGADLGSSVPGLHFLGALAYDSFGPLMRFVAGTPYASRALERAVRPGVPRAA